MENQQKSLFASAMSYGLYLGLAWVLIQVIFYVIGNPFSQSMSYAIYALLIGGIYIGMRGFGNQAGEEGFSYGRALGFGVAQAFFASILLGFFTFILYKFIDTGLKDQLIIFTEEKLLAKGMAEDQIEMAMNMVKKTMSPVILGFSQILNMTFLGFLVSLIFAIFMKKKPANPFVGVE